MLEPLLLTKLLLLLSVPADAAELLCHTRLPTLDSIEAGRGLSSSATAADAAVAVIADFALIRSKLLRTGKQPAPGPPNAAPSRCVSSMDTSCVPLAAAAPSFCFLYSRLRAGASGMPPPQLLRPFPTAPMPSCATATAAAAALPVPRAMSCTLAKRLLVPVRCHERADWMELLLGLDVLNSRPPGNHEPSLLPKPPLLLNLLLPPPLLPVLVPAVEAPPSAAAWASYAMHAAFHACWSSSQLILPQFLSSKSSRLASTLNSRRLRLLRLEAPLMRSCRKCGASGCRACINTVQTAQAR